MRHHKHIHHWGMVLVIISLINILFVLPAEAALAKPTLSAVVSVKKINKDQKFTVSAATKPLKGQFINRIEISLSNGQKKVCKITNNCQAQFGSFLNIKTSQNYKYTVKAFVKSGKQEVYTVKYGYVMVYAKLTAAIKTKNTILPNAAPSSTISVTTTPNNTVSPDQNFLTTTTANQAPQSLPAPADSKRLTDLDTILNAINMYYTDNGSYPNGNQINLGTTNYSCINSDGFTNYLDCPYPYLQPVPADHGYGYYYTGAGNSFYVETKLDGIINGLNGKIRLTPNGVVAY